MVGTILKRARKASGLTQAQLGAKTGLDGTYISRIERGLVGVPGRELLERLAGVLGLRYEDFFARGNPEPEDDPLVEAARRLSLARPDVRHKHEQIRAKYKDRPEMAERIIARLVQMWGSNADGLADTELDKG
jgi:transcriptional regulator with XRE-family HTH domain